MREPARSFPCSHSSSRRRGAHRCLPPTAGTILAVLSDLLKNAATQEQRRVAWSSAAGLEHHRGTAFMQVAAVASSSASTTVPSRSHSSHSSAAAAAGAERTAHAAGAARASRVRRSSLTPCSLLAHNAAAMDPHAQQGHRGHHLRVLG